MIQPDEVAPIIQRKFAHFGGQAFIPLLENGSFSARIVKNGVWVSNLGATPFLPWVVFQEAVWVIMCLGGQAVRGNAMNCRLGEPGLSLDSIEGHIAHKVYSKKIGDSVFRRITPIAAILVWTGICKPEPGALAMISDLT